MSAKHRKFAMGDKVALTGFRGTGGEIVRLTEGQLPTVQVLGGSRINVHPDRLVLISPTNRPN